MNKPLWLLAGMLCAVPVLGQNQPTDPRMAAGCGPVVTQFRVKVDKAKHEIVQPEAGKSLVYVIVQERPHPGEALYIGNITTRVGADGKWVGANYGESYVSFVLEPGEHRLCSDWQSAMKSKQKLADAADLTAQAGRTYYFLLELVSGAPINGTNGSGVFPSPELKLKAVDESAGMLLVSKTGQSRWEVKK
jgi:hypothetical protein